MFNRLRSMLALSFEKKKYIYMDLKRKKGSVENPLEKKIKLVDSASV